MDHRNIRSRLRRLAKTARAQYPKLNYGGCCVFAAAVATELEKHGVKYEVISVGNEHTNLNELRPSRNTVDDWNSMGVGFGHVGVRLKLKGRWYTYDSDRPLVPGKYKFGFDGYGYWQAAKGGITAAEATELANEPAWNRQFWKRSNVEGVREMVKEAFQ